VYLVDPIDTEEGDRPTWLDLAHKRLDEAVFAAYSWKNVLSDEEILERAKME
jgi:hypothetical protein